MDKSKLNHSVFLPDIAVIVATRNEGKTLKACLDSILEAAQGKAEVIVVDDGSTDDTQEILKAYGGRVTVFREEGRGPGRARNQAIRQTSRPYVAFTDGDCVVAPDWLEVLASALNGRPRTVASVGGVQTVSRSAGAVERWVGGFFETVGFVSDYLHGAGEVREVLHNPTCNVLYWKNSIERAEHFDESLWPCEDLELDLRLRDLGFSALFTPKAAVEHRRPATFWKFFGMMRRYGFAHAQLVKKRGFCQKIHKLAYAPVLLVLFFFSAGRWILLSGLVAAGVFLGWRSRSPFRGLLYSILAATGAGMWVFGFYSGLIGARRVASHG